MSVLFTACAESRAPAPPETTSLSRARYVEWRAPSDEVRAPIARVTDAPGGPLDRIASDPDVTTFLNDRFHPVFVERTDATPPALVFLDGCGCVLRAPPLPADARAFIAEANAVMVDPASRRCLPSPPGRNCTDAPTGQ